MVQICSIFGILFSKNIFVLGNIISNEIKCPKIRFSLFQKVLILQPKKRQTEGLRPASHKGLKMAALRT